MDADAKREYMAGWRERNRERIRDAQRARRAEFRSYVAAYKEKHGCSRCGENDHRCLQLHHRDPSQKKFQISVVTRYWNLDTVRAELEKCEVMCANCHLKEHDGNRWTEFQTREVAGRSYRVPRGRSA